jgi:transposase
MLVSQRTQLLNALRGHLTEVGVIAPQGPRHARELAELIEACDECRAVRNREMAFQALQYVAAARNSRICMKHENLRGEFARNVRMTRSDVC